MTENIKNKKETSNEDKKQDKKNASFEKLINESIKFGNLKNECVTAAKLSLTGITNLVVNYEDPCLVDCFLKSCFELEELYKKTYEMDAVELQQGRPGQGIAAQYLDNLIYGTCETESNSESIVPVAKINPDTGKRERNSNGFVNRREVIINDFKDKLLVIKNIDFCLDFCQQKAGHVDPRALWIFDNFRNPSIKKGCRLLLVTNEQLKFPFKVRVIKFDPVDEQEANHIIDSFYNLYLSNGFPVALTDNQRKQIIRKISGLTYTEAGDALGEAMSKASCKANNKKEIDNNKIVKNLREKINRNFMEDASGLSHLTAKPWADYICPESSNFTYDVKKIVRDFSEINNLKKESNDLVKKHRDDSSVARRMDAIRSRMPHVIVLYGRGGVGKSAFPIHFAGLLDFDVWDFNIAACHSKWVGEGPERMREAMKKIAKTSHVVVRIDEYDRAIGSTTGTGQGMHEAHKQVEAEFMNWLQNNQEENLLVKNDIFLILTTNHKENITGPLLRSGRADLVIDIADFDAKSMKEAFISAPRRMENRGALIIGYDNQQSLIESIQKLDVDKLSELATQKGFTVRDVDVLIQEMAAHDYYFKKGQDGIPWSTESFVKVLEESVGSAKSEETCELKLGDRNLGKCEKRDDPQLKFAFDEECNVEFDFSKFYSGDYFK